MSCKFYTVKAKKYAKTKLFQQTGRLESDFPKINFISGSLFDHAKYQKPI